MTNLFLKLVNMSIAAGILILAVAIARHILTKAPKNIIYILWGMVAIRLLCPVSIESSFSLIPRVVSTRQVTASISETDSMLGDYFMVIWLCGALIMFGYSLISYVKMYSRLCTSIRLRDDIWQSEFIDTPFIFGVIKPKVYVPYGISESELQMVLAHEYSHLKQKDHLIKLFAFLILSVYWFNPLVWVAYILLCRDIEIACDERVVKNMLPKERKMYSEALLSLSTSNYTIAACPIFFGEVGVKMRIKKILTYKKSSPHIRVQAAAACVLLGVCFLSNPQQAHTKLTKVAKDTEPADNKLVAKEAISPQESNASESLSDSSPVTTPEVKASKLAEEHTATAKKQTPQKSVAIDTDSNAKDKTQSAIAPPSETTKDTQSQDLTEPDEVLEEEEETNPEHIIYQNTASGNAAPVD